MKPIPVVAIIDVGKTNKKLFLLDEQYKIVYERTAKFIETTDEDGDPCENLESLRLSVFDSLQRVFSKMKYDVKAVNFSAYGASFVYIDKEGNPLTPLYNYLKPYPPELQKKFYDTYGGEGAFSYTTASPVLGSLNSGMQLYRLKKERPEIFKKIKAALHFPQYLSFLLTGKVCSDITSIGCHTNLWNFKENKDHEWVTKEVIAPVLPPLCNCEEVSPAILPGKNYVVGTGLHDSSAAVIPYLVNFQKPFVLISTGTWCISLNPFNHSPLTQYELAHDMLCYMQYKGSPVKASRLFAGHEHDEQVKRIAEYFNQDVIKYRTIEFNPEVSAQLQRAERPADTKQLIHGSIFSKRNPADFPDDIHAYHQLMADIMMAQQFSTQLVLDGTEIKRIFVDGGFSKNSIYMNLLAASFPKMEVFAAFVAQATALGAALAIHKAWNRHSFPNDLMKLQYYPANA
ncbi:MAG: carbohydrate kinase [Chitinophagaceae bacterium]|nr:carbohydrate kinase [Chitinophagaceae bacterium]